MDLADPGEIRTSEKEDFDLLKKCRDGEFSTRQCIKFHTIGGRNMIGESLSWRRKYLTCQGFFWMNLQ